MRTYLRLCWLSFLLSTGKAWTQSVHGTSFHVIPLGIRGGLDESNLSAYMVAPQGSNAYICLDAGTLHAGIQKALDKGFFGGAPLAVAAILKDSIKAYFISHPHLDHVAGLILNSPDDGPKPIYGLPYTLDVLKEKYFTWESWANFGDAGEKPFLNKYHYLPMSPGLETEVPGTAFRVKAFPLSHGAPYQSTAFLIRSGSACLLYLGDTGADEIEHSDKMALLWKEVARLLQAGDLKAIFIEVSFPDEQGGKNLFGHLTPNLLMKEMKALGDLAGTQALKGFPVVITHMKPSGEQEALIKKELMQTNPLQLQLVFPVQGDRLKL